VVDQVPLPHDVPAQVLFTVDVDGSDPSVFSARGTAVPSGPGWYQTLRQFESVASQWRTVGFDLMEPALIPGFNGYHFAAAPLVYKLIGKRFP
jgi:arginase family enzyme